MSTRSYYGGISQTGNLGSVNAASTELLMTNYVSGMQINGRISAVRRFFCLFVTFDLLFTSLFWVICILIAGKPLKDALIEDIRYYSIRTSMFDIVMAAGSRFVILLLFYVVLHINHWIFVALTTAGSCAFLIAKVLMYDWDKKAPYPFEVLLILISFLIAWAEAWFIDFRVLPQEARAKAILEAANNIQNADSAMPQLEAVRRYFNSYPETVADFYSPMESPLASDEDDDDFYRGGSKLTAKEREIQVAACDAVNLAWDLLNSSGWKLEKETSHGDSVYSKVGPKGSKIYKLVGEVDVDSNSLFKEMIYNFPNMSTWNNAVTLAKVIQTIDSNTDVTYQVASEGPGGVVTARDFVNVRHWKKAGENWICGGISVTHDDEPPQKSIVRGENGPGCWVFRPIEGMSHRCCFEWLLDTDLKGWIPQYVIDQALIHAMVDFMNCIRGHVPVIRKSSDKYSFS